MTHSANLIALLATGFGLALIFGYLANYFKIPSLVGYLFAVLVFCASTDDVSNNRTAVRIEIILNMFCPNYMNS